MTVRRVSLDAAAERRLRELAGAAYPDEGCGVLVGRLSGEVAGVVGATSARNMVSDRSRDRYDLDPADLLRADRDARSRGLDVVGIWHSHPDSPARPSAFDTERAWVDYVYLICSTRAGGSADLNAFALNGEGGSFEQVELGIVAQEQAGRP